VDINNKVQGVQYNTIRYTRLIYIQDIQNKRNIECTRKNTRQSGIADFAPAGTEFVVIWQKWEENERWKGEL